MRSKVFLLILLLNPFYVFGSIQNSIIESMNRLTITDLDKKLDSEQTKAIVNASPLLNQRLRVMSFNMLFNLHDLQLDSINRWEDRKSRVIDYIKWSNADVIGSQELQEDQLKDILAAVGQDYDYYGTYTEEEGRTGEIPAIFYRKERLELVKAQTFYYSDTPEQPSKDPFGKRNAFTCCLLKDKNSDRQFLVFNTHFAFSTAERRYDEACKLRDFLLKQRFELPLLITGDFNTFPFRQELDLPFYDGNQVMSIIEQAHVLDSLKIALFGHFGPLSSTNFCPETNKPFSSLGTPGVILDHIFVSRDLCVLAHGIDPAKVDDHFPSDHFPVLVDVLLK